MFEEIIKGIVREAGGILALVLSVIAVTVLFVMFMKKRISYLRYKHYSTIEYVLLQLRLPRDIFRTPEAMEIVFNNAFYHKMGGPSTMWSEYVGGKTLPIFQLEVVSVEGDVRFYIRTPVQWKDNIEAQFYAQFPGIEISEAEDYTLGVPPKVKGDGMSLVRLSHTLAKEDAYPIKTYRDWGMDKQTGKEEFEKIDPLNSLIEMLGSLGPNEQMWIHFHIRAQLDNGWREIGKKLVDEITGRNEKPSKDQPYVSFKTISKGDQDTVAAIERSLGLIGFKVAISALYIAQNNSFKMTRVAGMQNMWNSFNSYNLNSIRADWFSGFNNDWQDYKDFLSHLKDVRSLEDQRQRRYFEVFNRGTWFDFYITYIDGYNHPDMILTSEELATLFHFPGRALESPSVQRLEAKRSEPPANLPI